MKIQKVWYISNEANKTITAHKIIAGIINQIIDPTMNLKFGSICVALYNNNAIDNGTYIPSIFLTSLKNSIVTFDKNKLAPEDGKVIKTLLSSAI